MGDGGWIDQLVLEGGRVSIWFILGIGHVFRTGTFFWDKTTAQFFPRTPTDVMLAAVIALKAYSAHRCKHELTWRRSWPASAGGPSTAGWDEMP